MALVELNKTLDHARCFALDLQCFSHEAVPKIALYMSFSVSVRPLQLLNCNVVLSNARSSDYVAWHSSNMDGQSRQSRKDCKVRDSSLRMIERHAVSRYFEDSRFLLDVR